MSDDIQLLLEHHFFPHIQVTANPNYVPSTSPMGRAPINSHLDVAKTQDSPLRYQAQLHVTLNAQGSTSSPYSIDVISIGHISFSEPQEEGKKPHEVVANTAFRLLFPAIRELVLTLTARQPWGQFSIGMSAPPKPEPAIKRRVRRKRKDPAIAD